MSLAMTKKERDEFLAGVHIGVLSVPRDGAGPLTCPVWYSYEPGGEIVFVTGADSRKAGFMSAGTRVSFCAQTEAGLPKYVTVEGPIVSIEKADIEAVRPIAHRYRGEEVGNSYLEQSRSGPDAPMEIRVCIQPERWLSADFAKRFATLSNTAETR
jgi:general stress protein 26